MPQSATTAIPQKKKKNGFISNNLRVSKKKKIKRKE
jgi:hypothetical protein